MSKKKVWYLCMGGVSYESYAWCTFPKGKEVREVSYACTGKYIEKINWNPVTLASLLGSQAPSSLLDRFSELLWNSIYDEKIPTKMLVIKRELQGMLIPKKKYWQYIIGTLPNSLPLKNWRWMSGCGDN